MNENDFKYSNIIDMCKNIKSLNFIKNSKFEFIHFLQQDEDEWEDFIEFLKSINIQNALEIGTHGGGTFYTICQIANENANLISLDKEIIPYLNLDCKTKAFNMFKKYNQKIHIIINDSHSVESLSKVEEILQNNKLDYLFIDGDNTYAGVKNDFEMYSPLVKDGEIVVFHDIMYVDIYDFLEEIKINYKYLEFLKSTRRNGICVIWK